MWVWRISISYNVLLLRKYHFALCTAWSASLIYANISLACFTILLHYPASPAHYSLLTFQLLRFKISTASLNKSVIHKKQGLFTRKICIQTRFIKLLLCSLLIFRILGSKCGVKLILGKQLELCQVLRATH